MSRRPSIIPTIQLTTRLPEDIHTRLSLHLYSELEQRIPPSAWQNWICERAREYFSDKRMDISHFFNGVEGEFVVKGSAATLSHLLNALKEKK